MKVPREKFNEVSRTWQNLPASMRKCPNCGRTLSGQVQDAWADNQEEAWAYVECPRCGDIAFWKVVQGWKKWGDRDASPGGDTRR